MGCDGMHAAASAAREGSACETPQAGAVHVVATAARFRDRVAGFLVARPSNCVLLIAPCRSVHTFGMRVDLDVAFFDSDGTVMRAVRNVHPGRIERCPKAYGVLERVSNRDTRWYVAGEEVLICIGG